MRNFLLGLILFFVGNSFAGATDMPALKELHLRQAWSMVQDPHLYSHWPIWEYFSEHRFLVPEMFKVAKIEYKLNEKSLNLPGTVDSEFSQILDQILVTPLGSQMLKTLRKSGIQKLKISLYFLAKENHWVDSWTDTQMNTYVFLSGSKLTRQHLLRVFSHELAQMTQSVVTPDQFIHLETTRFSEQFQSCGLQQFLTRPDIRLLISTRRAFSAERQMLAPEPPSQLTCGQRIKRTLGLIRSFHLTIEKELVRWQADNPAVCASQQLTAEFMQLLSDSAAGEELCLWLEQPRVSEKINLNGSFGPRPAIGSGGD